MPKARQHCQVSDFQCGSSTQLIPEHPTSPLAEGAVTHGWVMLSLVHMGLLCTPLVRAMFARTSIHWCPVSTYASRPNHVNRGIVPAQIKPFHPIWQPCRCASQHSDRVKLGGVTFPCSCCTPIDIKPYKAPKRLVLALALDWGTTLQPRHFCSSSIVTTAPPHRTPPILSIFWRPNDGVIIP